MSAANAEQNNSFFRQSGWLMFANVASGGLMYAVHFFSKVIPKEEYKIFGTLLALTICVPTIPLQMLFAQQAAAALTTGRVRQMTGTFRAVCLFTTLIWGGFVIATFILQKQLIAFWKISNPAALWVTLFVILASALLPMFLGLVQGKQDFLTFGLTSILNGIGRIGFGAVIVLLFGGVATGIMGATFLGLALALGLAAWKSRDLWLGPVEPFNRQTLRQEVVPLVVGFGACQFLMAADTLFVTAYLSEDAECYVAAGTLARAMVWAVGPLTAVMFPRIVASAARAEKSNLFGLTLICTAGIATLGAVGLWALGPWIVRLMAKPSFVGGTMQLLPWYAGAMVPMCVALVLASNLLGKAQFRVVIPLALLAVAYGGTLYFKHDSHLQVIQLLGLFNFLLLGICAFFTWGLPQRAAK